MKRPAYDYDSLTRPAHTLQRNKELMDDELLTESAVADPGIAIGCHTVLLG